ncbi:MAG TPA: hypothetical protein VF713_19915 [Thermoanaerobaculia bacterium]
MSGLFLSLELRVCVLAAIVFAPAAIASDAAVDVVSQNGVAFAMAPLTLRDLPPVQPAFHPIHEDRRRIVERESKTALATSVLPPATVPSIVAPPLTAQFPATYDVDQGYPSDANGAVGPRHLLSVSNQKYTVADRSGKILWQDFNYGFWSDPTVAAGGSEYDARAAYDPVADRWVIVSLFDRGTSDSTLLVAVSASGDPMGTWKRFRVPVGGTIVTFLDFTRLALARDAIVITANLCGRQSCSQQADIFVIQKKDAYNAAQPVPFARFHFEGPFDLIPVTVHGDDPTVRILAEDAVNVDVYAIQNGGLVGVASFPFSAILGFDWGIFQTQIAPQMGSTSTIDIGWPMVQYAVERNGLIWIVESIIHNARSSIVWYRLHLPLSSSSIVDKGLIDDPTGNLFYGYPSIDVNAAGGALIGYSTFGSQQFPSANYSYIDQLGHLSQMAPLKAGERSYWWTRWGDYSMTVVDPVNDIDFWTIQTYSMTRPGGYTAESFTLWATYWGKITSSNTIIRRHSATH